MSDSESINRTIAGMDETYTTQGFVPHLPVSFEGGRLLAPLKLATAIGARGAAVIAFGGPISDPVPVPLVRRGMFVFALPGGAEILAAPSTRR